VVLEFELRASGLLGRLLLEPLPQIYQIKWAFYLDFEDNMALKYTSTAQSKSPQFEHSILCINTHK
jgi:hypothetical protein